MDSDQKELWAWLPGHSKAGPLGTCLYTQTRFLELLTVNCGPAMKGSGNGVTVSTGNVFIFKREKRQERYFRVRKHSFAVFGSAPLQSNGRIRGEHTHGAVIARVRNTQERGQWLYLCSSLYCEQGLSRDDGTVSCLGAPVLTLPWNPLHWGLPGPPRHAGPAIWPDPLIRVYNAGYIMGWLLTASLWLKGKD